MGHQFLSLPPSLSRPRPAVSFFILYLSPSLSLVSCPLFLFLPPSPRLSLCLSLGMPVCPQIDTFIYLYYHSATNLCILARPGDKGIPTLACSPELTTGHPHSRFRELYLFIYLFFVSCLINSYTIRHSKVESWRIPTFNTFHKVNTSFPKREAISPLVT